ncbi:coiled-coil domain-containing protein 24 [Echeneis naucrates]|uniref:coiled-coil domain-containing protein 24 n=1 Tax=Echeneis naucrates TaxID=173247 RepID=UPI0011135A90|nr:coiled-coil domain-containing protein 24 [Echeneis naucrates]
MQSPDEGQPWCLGPSLWSLIAEHVPGPELSKIRTALGFSLVGMYTEVYAEAEMWHQMWQESQQGGNHGSRALTPLPRQQSSPLADPPAVKELLKAEVKMLLETLRERVSRGGRDGEEVLSQYKPETVKYALNHLDSCYNTHTNPEDTDCNENSSHCSIKSNVEDEFEAVRDKLNVTDIDLVVDRLKFPSALPCLLPTLSLLSFLCIPCFEAHRNNKAHCQKMDPRQDHSRQKILFHLWKGIVYYGYVTKEGESVGERGRSVFIEETEVLNGMVKQFKRRIKQQWRSQCEPVNSEPTLSELKGLRETIQMDLELYPSSLVTSPPASPPLPVKELKSRFRLTAGQNDSAVIPQALNTTSVLRPHPPSLLCHSKPRPPSGPRPTQTPGSVRPHHTSSSSKTCGHHRSLLASIKSSETSSCNKIPTSRHVSDHIITGQIKLKNEHLCILSPEQGNTSVNCRPSTPGAGFQMRTQRGSPVHEAHQSSHHSIHSLSRECHLSPQRERESSSDWRSGNINSTSPTPSLSPRSDADSYSNTITDLRELTTGKTKTSNGQSTCSTESFSSSVMSEARSTSSKIGDSRSNSQTDRNKNDHLEKNFLQKEISISHCVTDPPSNHSENSGEQVQAQSPQPASPQFNKQFFMSPQRTHGGAISQPKSIQEKPTEFISKFYQPVPPSRVST